MLDRVDNEVTDDALDTAFINLGRDSALRHSLDAHVLSLREFRAAFDDTSDDGTQVAVLGVQQGAGRVVA